MSKELAISDAQMDKLVSVGYTGHDIGAGAVYPSVVNILQSDKQYEAFVDGDSITKKMYGKLFVRTDSNKVEDLVDSIEGTVVKIERGYEIRSGENKIEESGYGFLDAIEKGEWEEKGMKPVNMVKVLLALGSFTQVDKKMQELKNKVSRGETPSKADYPFCIVAVKGASFGNWFNVEKGMQDLANEHFHRPLNQIPTIAFKLIVKSAKEEGSDFTYYTFDFDVVANEAEEAINFTPYLLEAKTQPLFYKVKERINREEVFDEMKETAGIVEDEDVVVDTGEEMDELPFN